MSSIEEPDTISPLIGRRVLGDYHATFRSPIDVIGAERIAVMAHIIIETSRKQFKQLTVLRGNAEHDFVPWIYVANESSFNRLAYGSTLLRHIAGGPDLPLCSGKSDITIGSGAQHKHVLGKNGYVAPVHARVWVPAGGYDRVAIEDQSGKSQQTIVYANWANVFSSSEPAHEPDDLLDNVIEFPELRAN